MLMLSVQKYNQIQMVYSIGYTPDILKSEYIFISPRYLDAYMKMSKELRKKDKSGNPLSFYWGWVKNPYLSFYSMKNTKNSVGTFVEIPESKVVVSNYDRYCDYLNEDTDTLEISSYGDCLQGVFRSITPTNIVSVVRLNDLISLYKLGYTSLHDLYSLSRVKDIKYKMDIFSLPDYSFSH